MRNSNSPYGQINVKYDFPASDPAAHYSVSMSRPDKIRLLLTSGILGICILLFHYTGEYFAKLLAKTGIMDYYMTSEAIFNVVQILYSFACILIPFGLGAIALHFLNKDRELLPLQKPNSGRMLAASLGIGFLSLIVSNYITTFFVLGAESFGLFFETGESPAADSASSFLWQVLSTAVVPALVEEFAVRGVVMQSLRKYGDIFAIVTSAVIFALLHGNMVQAPFALLLGCVIGWLVIVTDSLWTGIAIHFMNNFYATVMNALSTNAEEYVYIPVFLIVNLIGTIFGIIAVIKTVDRYRHTLKLNEPGGNTSGARIRYRAQAFLYMIISLPMAASFVVLIVDIVKRVHFIGAVGA